MPRVVSSLLSSLLIAWSASAVVMDWTPVEDLNYVCDAYFNGTCRGAVQYPFQIGTYEVTNAQYAEFLNAKAAADPLELYDAMEMGNTYGGIARSGSSGSYTYSVLPGRGEMPVSFVSFYDALRFANWMNNGQGNGDTETGAYTLLGGTPTPSNGSSVTRNGGVTIVLANENEWHKAAYYVPLSGSTYFDYSASANTAPTCAAASATPNTANCDFAVFNFTPVGSYTNSASPYGTFDQGGNVMEWNDTLFYPPDPPYNPASGCRGGNIFLPPSFTWAGQPGACSPTGSDLKGFRLVTLPLPEPSAYLLLSAGALALAGLSWRKTRA